MKKRGLALMLAGILAVSVLAGCGSDGDKKDNAATPTPTAAAEKEATPTEAPKEEEDGFSGLWVNDKTGDSWLQIEGDSWTLINYMGEEADGGSVELSDGKANLIDGKGEPAFTLSIVDGGLFEEVYQESYSAADNLPDFDNVVDIAPIVGDWYYEKMDEADQTVFNRSAYIIVGTDGAFTIYWDDEEEENTGVISIGYDEFSDGTTLPMYQFMVGGNNLLFSCYCEQEDPDVFWIGNGGVERLSRPQGQGSVDYSGRYSEPPTGRSLIEMEEQADGIHYTINVSWSNGAAQCAFWEIEDAVYQESSGVLEYTGAKYYVRTSAADGSYTDDVKYTNGTGRFWYEEDGLHWESDNSDVDEYDGQTVFQRLSD